MDAIAGIVGLAEHLADARADVERAVVALRTAGLLDEIQTFRLESPIAVARAGHLITGYLDFVGATAHETVVSTSRQTSLGA